MNSHFGRTAVDLHHLWSMVTQHTVTGRLQLIFRRSEDAVLNFTQGFKKIKPNQVKPHLIALTGDSSFNLQYWVNAFTTMCRISDTERVWEE